MKRTGKVALITNVSHFYCLRAALRVMRPAGRGKIVNMPAAG